MTLALPARRECIFWPEDWFSTERSPVCSKPFQDYGFEVQACFRTHSIQTCVTNQHCSALQMKIHPVAGMQTPLQVRPSVLVRTVTGSLYEGIGAAMQANAMQHHSTSKQVSVFYQNNFLVDAKSADPHASCSAAFK